MNERNDEKMRLLRELDDSSVVVLRPLRSKCRDDGDYIIGCEDVRRFIELDEEGTAVVEQLQQPGTLGEHRQTLLTNMGEEYDLVEFVQYLAERDLVDSIDGVDIRHDLGPQKKPLLEYVPIPWLQWLQSAWIPHIVAALAMVWVVLAVGNPQIVPSPADLRITDRPMMVFMMAFGSLLGTAFIHELAHYFTARSYGLRAPIQFNSRVFVMVMETDVTNAWLLPREARKKIFMAGMLYNSAVLALTGIIATYLVSRGAAWDAQAIKWLMFIGYVNLFPLIFQLFLFARTDIYFLLIEWLREKNLVGDSKSYMKFRSNRFMRWMTGFPKSSCLQCRGSMIFGDPFCLKCGGAHDDRIAAKWTFSHKSLRRVRWFGVILAVGNTYAAFFILRVVPRIQSMMMQIGLDGIDRAMRSHDWFLAVESGLFLCIVTAQAGFLAWMVVKKGYRFIRVPVRFVYFLLFPQKAQKRPAAA